MIKNMNVIVFGNVHKIDQVYKNVKDSYLILESSRSDLDDKDNTIFYDSLESNKKENAYCLRKNEISLCKEKYSVQEMINGNIEEQVLEMDPRQVVPLFFFRKQDDVVDIYSQLRFTKEDLIFIKTGTYQIKEDTSYIDLVDKAIKIHAENFVFLGNHQCYYSKMNAAKEIEYKFNIVDDTDPWVMINDIIDDVNSQKLDNYIFEYRDDFQKWDYMNYMFKINGNEEEKGYISFIPQTNGKYLIKRKIYQKDQLSRTEIHYKNVDIQVPLKEYIENYFGLKDYVEFPPFRRVRYDINIECCKTGNVHGIFFDYISVEGNDKILKQCEIEYLRTRSLFENDEYRNELDYLRDYMKTFFEKRSVDYRETFYSKLSFMTDLYQRK